MKSWNDDTVKRNRNKWWPSETATIQSDEYEIRKVDNAVNVKLKVMVNRESNEEDKGKETTANVKQDSTDDGQLQGVVIGVRVQHTETRTEAGVDGDGDGAVSLTVTAENAEPTTNMDRLKWCCNLWKRRGKNGGEADGFELDASWIIRWNDTDD